MSAILERLWLAEIEGYNPLIGDTETLYFSTAPIEPFAPDDGSRPNAHYMARLKGSGSLSRELFSGMRSFGASAVNAGEVTLSNADGELDYLAGWGFDGRDITIYEGVPGQPFSNFTIALKATMSQAEFSYSKKQPARLVLRIRDFQYKLNLPIQNNLYAGTNVATVGDEGTEDDIAGRPKPLAFGIVRNIRPAPCNSLAHRYQVHDGAGTVMLSCFDNGVLITRNDTNPQPGEYSFDANTGILTLGGPPAGEVTCELSGATSAGFTVASIIKYILTEHLSMSADDLVEESFTDLDTANSSAVGIYIDAETTVAQVLDQLCASIGAYWTFTRAGLFRVGRIEAPALPERWSFGRRDIVEITRMARQDALPPYRVSLRYCRNWTVQNSDGLAGASPEAWRTWVSLMYRTVDEESATVKDKHPLSRPMERDSLIDGVTDAQAECNRLLALYGEDRHTFSITVKATNALKAVELGDVVKLTLDRFSLNDGVPFVVLGIKDNVPREGRMTFTIWG